MLRYNWSNSDVHPADSLFGILEEHLGKKGIASCIISGSNGEEAESCGLHTKHFYSILRVSVWIAFSSPHSYSDHLRPIQHSKIGFKLEFMTTMGKLIKLRSSSCQRSRHMARW